MWMETYRLLESQLGKVRQVRWKKAILRNVALLWPDAKERVDFPWYNSPYIGTSPNHYAQWAGNLLLAGRMFGNEEWECLGATILKRFAAVEQTEDGYWGEHSRRGPTTGYNHLTLASVALYWELTADPVDGADDGADPDASSVVVEIAGVTLSDPEDYTESPADSGRFEGSILFDDPRFNPSLEGLNTVTIRAANTRTNGPVTREKYTVFDADSEGPLIVIDSPSPGTLISGIFTLTATVTDDAGVDDLSVIATIMYWNFHNRAVKPRKVARLM